jgi:hypothetical protein
MARADTGSDFRVYEEKKTSNSFARSRQGHVGRAKKIGGTSLQCNDSHLPLLFRRSWSRPRGHREFDLARVAVQWFEAHLFVGNPPMSFETSPTEDPVCRSPWCVPDLNPGHSP